MIRRHKDPHALSRRTEREREREREGEGERKRKFRTMVDECLKSGLLMVKGTNVVVGKGLVSRTLSPVGRRTATPTKVEKVSGRFPPLRSRLQHTQPVFPSSLLFLFFFHPSGSYVALLPGISLFRTDTARGVSLNRTAMEFA